MTEPERATVPVLPPDDVPTRTEADPRAAAVALRAALLRHQDEVETLVPCPRCRGRSRCALCGGTGMVTTEVRRLGLGP